MQKDNKRRVADYVNWDDVHNYFAGDYGGNIKYGLV